MSRYTVSLPASRLAAVLLLLTAVPLWAGTIVDSLPTAERWLEHYRDDLQSFWTRSGPVGSPPGRFPTIVLRDGTTLDQLAAANPDSVRGRFDRRSVGMYFAVAVSRQAYLYCVGYHLTGDTTLLALAKAGIDFLLGELRDQNGAFWYMVDRNGHKTQNTDWRGREQEQCAAESYGLLAPAMYYYLTRDPEMLAAVRQTRVHIFEVFSGNNPNWRLLMDASGSPEQASIGTQLDVINGFMFLMTPMLPRDEGRMWQRDMARLLDGMVSWMYCPKTQGFRMRVSRWERPSDTPDLVSVGFDAKAFWYLYLYGQRYGERAYCDLAMTAGRTLAGRAFMPDVGGWAGSVSLKDGPERRLNHFAYAECDQLMATLALRDTSYARYLPQTNRVYFEHLVDREYGGVYDGVGADFIPGDERKGAEWKHDFHASEHALVGYITAHAIRGESVPLYYAFGGGVPERRTITPYHFTGKVSTVDDLGAIQGKGLRVYRVTFEGVH